ncbi:MAG: hypothetical protein K0R05_3759 [Anaerocolumna sp.]|jgi:hypothetical protein|nr:hypothetical protein [Anaerocolumna sp.]
MEYNINILIENVTQRKGEPNVSGVERIKTQ